MTAAEDLATAAWASGAGPPVHAGDGKTITLVEGLTFCVS